MNIPLKDPFKCDECNYATEVLREAISHAMDERHKLTKEVGNKKMTVTLMFEDES